MAAGRFCASGVGVVHCALAYCNMHIANIALLPYISRPGISACTGCGRVAVKLEKGWYT